MASTSCSERAAELLGYCLRGERWPASLLNELLEPECTDALLRIAVERLADLFEPRLCGVYADLFSAAIAHAIPELNARDLVARYQRIRRTRSIEGQPETVLVLSRVTLGADVAITSVLLDAAKRRFPRARIVLAGGLKAAELFAGDPRIEHMPAAYVRAGSLAERLASWRDLRRTLSVPHSIVVDPDSRLTQLGLLPVCAEENYYFFESRAYGDTSADALPVLAARWARETLGISGAAPYLAPRSLIEVPGRPFITVSLGVGENQAKRVADPFEEQLIELAARTGAHVLIDEGAGGEEAARVARAIEQCGSASERVRSFRGSFAAFASAISASDLYIGYDSAGQHVAAAAGVPLISIFAGFVSPRFLARWRPVGKGRIEVIAVAEGEQPIERCAAAIENFTASARRG